MRHVTLLFSLIVMGCGPSPGTGSGTNPVRCSDDADCADGFCGWDANNARLCKPYGELGDSCGGRVLPEYRVVCDPELLCYGEGLVYDAPGECVERCTDDSDCTDGYCGWVNGGADRICEPWAEIGEQCEGRVAADDIAYCAPDLECGGPRVFNGPGTCYDACTTEWDDSECRDGSFCSPGGWNGTTQNPPFCRPYVGEGETCGGFMPPDLVGICDEGLSCSYAYVPPYIADHPGVCAVDCTSDGDCSNGQYCSDQNTCLSPIPAGGDCTTGARECEAGTTCVAGTPLGYSTCLVITPGG